ANDCDNFYSIGNINIIPHSTEFNISFENQDKVISTRTSDYGKKLAGYTIIGQSQVNTLHIALGENGYSEFKIFFEALKLANDPDADKDKQREANKYIKEQNNFPHFVHTILHEWGHSCGLEGQEKSDYKELIGLDNLMYHDDFLNPKGYRLITKQFEEMKDTISNQQE
ncbi:MAG: hypothetical protein QG635_300, partial [Bacteroidota bacterium]|nr:hypothetical protein [Bacteroidota bacterium]